MTTDKYQLTEEIRNLIASFGIGDEASFTSDMEKFRIFLSEENEKYNLTRLTSPADFWIKHVIDSLYILKYFPEIKTASLKVADIGSGAGLPAIIIAKACPNLRLAAVDSSAKKSDFIVRAAGLLSLKNLSVVNLRANDMAKKKEWWRHFDIITARAVSTGCEIFRETRNMLGPKGRYVLYKTPRQAETELCELRNLTGKEGYMWDCTETFNLPENMGARVFISGMRQENLHKIA